MCAQCVECGYMYVQRPEVDIRTGFCLIHRGSLNPKPRAHLYGRLALAIPPLCLLRLYIYKYRYIYTYLFIAPLTALLPHQHPQLHGLTQSLKRYLKEIL